jgi:uncharacterized membrane protein YoaK (UPF0700 family)
VKPVPRNVTPSVVEINALIEAHYKARRKVMGHFVFFLLCVILAFIARRFLKFPPQLSWVVIAAFLVAFAGDLTRFVYRKSKLQRLLAAYASS